MPNIDPLAPRPTLTHPSQIAQALRRLCWDSSSETEIWSRLTQSFAVDLDAVAALLPPSDPEPVWLNRREA